MTGIQEANSCMVPTHDRARKVGNYITWRLTAAWCLPMIVLERALQVSVMSIGRVRGRDPVLPVTMGGLGYTVEPLPAIIVVT
eukprot:1160703-Pelagomonas_calceolata.AAC.15